jgi:Tfp pilus assembly major pilin PilA
MDPLTVVTDHLEKNYIVFLTTTVVMNTYIRFNGIKHLHLKVVKKQLGNSPFITVIMDLSSVAMDVIDKKYKLWSVHNCCNGSHIRCNGQTRLGLESFNYYNRWTTIAMDKRISCLICRTAI